jgi:hypothetical protein
MNVTDPCEPILQTEYEGVLNLISAAKNQEVKKVRHQAVFDIGWLVLVSCPHFLQSPDILSLDRPVCFHE